MCLGPPAVDSSRHARASAGPAAEAQLVSETGWPTIPFVQEDPMKYKVVMERSDEGYSISVPGLPGCWSQGASEAEAIAKAIA